ncbi:VID27-domain-containing protein [Guyanagaster necrorhizus]|uniref:VID27-domain-containing protein n=1 Tax=Guyanagaster necrorhizus TaxID=856835 RepID=A0A9P8AWQ1_9AGAR|nr:VID27-domain-containing protein [Guyanagaster necrorhizus MCA 3950]KAG7449137.1 VID27-domain-containing protein [Guyanagaster necrorhizus MCA 3950]
MNLFRNLLGRVWQDPNAAEVVKISSGQLYLIRPGNIRSSRECIYNDAMATIRRIPSAEHNFHLVITRVYEEGDQELLEDEDETDEERSFLIADELEFRSGETDGEPTFIWRDLEGDVDEFYEYVATNTNAPMKVFFETCMYRAMYERKYKVSGDNISEKELEEFIWKPSQIQTKAPPSKKHETHDDLPATPTPVVSEAIAKGKAKAEVVSKEPTLQLFSSEAELWLWCPDEVQDDGNIGMFFNQGIVTAEIIQHKGQYKFWLTAKTDDDIVLAHEISTDMNHKSSTKMFSLTWNHWDGEESSSWLVKFPSDPELYNSFLELFLQALWETKFQSPFSKQKAEDQRYILSADEDVVMIDIEDEDEEEVLSELEPEDDYGSEGEEEDDVPSQLPGEKNSMLMVGYKGDRSYVLRGNKIGVFNHTADYNVKYHLSIGNISTTAGKAFTPKHVMLHEQDSKMILMNPADPNSLYNMDIERGKVVEEWKIHDDVTVSHIAPDNKFAQTTHEQTLVGASHNALFRIDPRVSGKKLVDSQFKQYAGKNKFSGVTTTAVGKIAVASEKGDIRLFDSIGKNAKTALPPLGDPIVGIDVTADGRWIVATTKTYLLLIDTLIGEGKWQGSLGFDRSFPATSKPIPRRLQLRSEHVAYMNHDVSFTPARFNQGEGQSENAIVTSTGQYIVAWDFSKVKKGMLDRYEIKKYEDLVVQDNFKFGDDKEIIVALQNNVLAVNKKSLRKPTRYSLSGQVASARGHSNIVNAPY